ncbi:MAG: fimbria/pilus outer membrane usher protein [Neisseriaceae bacterium]|nr:fimbria/pilus outer membrane usher protein [Neisseriaceae bacterium]
MPQLSINLKTITASILMAFSACYANASVEFNTDILDVGERDSVDLSRFSEVGYVMPGVYVLDVYINKHALPQQRINYFSIDADSPETMACIPVGIIPKMLLKDDVRSLVKFSEDGQCADLSEIEGLTVTTNLGKAEMRINVPQAWLKYSDPDWTPPELWDDGIAGGMLDYNITVRTNKPHRGERTKDIGAYGTVGANLGAWRLRGDYQASEQHRNGQTRRDFDWTQIYAYRALPGLAAKLTVGEQYLNSDLIDGFRYIGANIKSDERMLPPSLQGYAPQVQGVATTNSTVTVSQEGRVVYKTTVPAGPFVIQDLSSSVRGKLQVTIEGDDGRLETFEVSTASIPYLTRPGQIRYNVSIGRPSDFNHDIEGPLIATGDFSWGASNSWSLFGGAVASEDYNSVAMGIGRDLSFLGAVSFDVTQSNAHLNNGKKYTGHSFRFNYAKRFDEQHGQITFAGYRFSERQFMTVSQFLSNRRNGNDELRKDKELYTVTASKTFWPTDPRKSITAYLSYTRQTYWDNSAREQQSLSMSKLFDIGGVKNISTSFSAYKNKQNGDNGKGFMLNMSVPMQTQRRTSIGYSLSSHDGKVSHNANLSGGEGYNNWQVSAGVNSDKHANVRGYVSRQTSLATVGMNADWQEKGYQSVGLEIRGGITATLKGVALHPNSIGGGARVFVDTGKVSGVPINDGVAVSNYFGKAVIPDVASYSDTYTRIDVDRMADDVEAPLATIGSTLTEGAIGYRKMDVVKGLKMLATVTQADGETPPPFGATVMNDQGKTIAVLTDGGLVYLSGVQEHESLSVVWGGSQQCQITVPAASVAFSKTVLTCQ